MFLSESAHLHNEGKELSIDRIYYANFGNVAVKLNGVTAVTMLSALRKALRAHPVLCTVVTFGENKAAACYELPLTYIPHHQIHGLLARATLLQIVCLHCNGSTTLIFTVGSLFF